MTEKYFELHLDRPSTDHTFRVFLQNNQVRVAAGCRDFNLREAQLHWGNPRYHRGSRVGNEALWIIHSLVTLANMAGWTRAKFAYRPVVTRTTRKAAKKAANKVTKKAVKKAARRR